MDQKIQAYIESLVLEVLQSPNMANLPEDQKNAQAEKIRNHLNNVVLDTVIDKLTPDQLNQIKDLPAESPQMADRLEQFSSQIPFLITDIEKKLNEEAQNIKQNPAILG